jgi:hypothetical protein
LPLSLLRLLLPLSLLRLLLALSLLRLLLALSLLLRGDSLGGLEGLEGVEGAGALGGLSVLGLSTFGFRSSCAFEIVAAAALKESTDANVTTPSLTFAYLYLKLRPP